MYCNDPVLDALGILDYADEQGSYYVENTVNNLVPPHRSYGYAGAHTDVVRDLVLDVDNLFDDAYNETREEWNDAEYCQIEPDSLYPTYYSAGYRAAAPLFFMPFSEASTDIPHSLPESPTDGFAPSDGNIHCIKNHAARC
eukprot:GEMP01062431.1.p1 GENE.GEMP01062431.1~~GEMP01062431.1.p1  ORF type:complete len:141 (-),score=37.66 GEMP01062431.1:658-1080(-)